MLPQIRDHSLLVAAVALQIAEMARTKGLPVSRRQVEASALLHDLAKTYTIRHGGNHSQLGGAWVVNLTGNLAVAQAVIHHVHWPGEIVVQKHLLPLLILYADKRVKHDGIVYIEDRFEDLFVRYGINEHRIKLMQRSLEQTRTIENKLSQELEVDLYAYPFDSRGLVQ
ncbi:MAG: HD domain-containing protein [Thermodesulfobacteriota bacterium]